MPQWFAIKSQTQALNHQGKGEGHLLWSPAFFVCLAVAELSIGKGSMRRFSQCILASRTRWHLHSSQFTVRMSVFHFGVLLHAISTIRWYCAVTVIHIYIYIKATSVGIRLYHLSNILVRCTASCCRPCKFDPCLSRNPQLQELSDLLQINLKPV